jgi:putative DNA primase/helicase
MENQAMAREKKDIADVLNKQDKGPKAHEGKVRHSDMAEAILAVRSFLTLNDTKQVLWYDYPAGIYRFNGETVIEQFAQMWLGQLGLESTATNHYMAQVVGYIQRETYIRRDELNPNRDIVVVKNGVIDLNTGKLLPHNKEYKATIAVPVTYDAGVDCPLITKFIDEVVKPQNRLLLWEIPAWCLTAYSGIQRLVMLLGEGANGKTVYLEMLRRFLGPENCTAYSLQSLTNNRFAIAGLYGKLANISPELPSTALRQVGPLKTLTGLDTVEAEKKFRDSFNFMNTAKMIFATNTPPEISEDTLAIWRRFVVIDFPFKFVGDRADKNLLAKLTTEKELSGLLNKALNGLARLKLNGDFSYTRSIEDTRDKYLLASNPVVAFIEERCEFDPWAIIMKKELHEAFMAFCAENKLPGMTIKAFGHKIKKGYMLNEERDKWRGIKIKAVGDGGER